MPAHKDFELFLLTDRDQAPTSLMRLSLVLWHNTLHNRLQAGNLHVAQSRTALVVAFPKDTS